MDRNSIKTLSKKLLIGSIVFALLPLATLLLSYLLSFPLGCDSSSGGDYSCKIGADTTGNIVYYLYTFGFYVFYTVPIGSVIAIFASFGYVLTRKQ